MATPPVGVHRPRMRTHAGTSFLELTVVLALVGLLLGIAAPSTLRWRDRVAVRAARDDLAAGLAAARATAAAAGGAALVLETGSARFWIAAGGVAGPVTDLAERYRVRVEGGSGTIEVRYDALGIGRLANRTLRLRRGAAEAGLTISAYGRVRRW